MNKVRNRNLARQIVAEGYYLAIYLACYFIGFFYRSVDVTEGTRRPVVLVPGLFGRSLSFYRLRRRLIEKGHPVYLIELGFQVGDIRAKARQVDRLLRVRGLHDCYLVGFSLGGFIAMTLSEESRTRIRHFITLSPGYQGAISSYLLFMFTVGWQTMHGSTLRHACVETARQTKNLTNIVAHWDEIVVPPSAYRLNITREIVVPEGGHIQLIMGSHALSIISQVIAELEEPA